MATETAVPVWGYELEHYVNIGTTESANWIKATELLSWEMAGEAKTYEPSWIDRKNNPTFTYGRSCTINFEKDTMRGGAIESWIMNNRNKIEIPCQIARVFTWLDAGEEGGNQCVADLAAFNFSPNAPHNNNQGQPVNMSGTFNMSDDDWTEGKWDLTTNTFVDPTASTNTTEETPTEG